VISFKLILISNLLSYKSEGRWFDSR